jgi:hypothetical protein
MSFIRLALKRMTLEDKHSIETFNGKRHIRMTAECHYTKCGGAMHAMDASLVWRHALSYIHYEDDDKGLSLRGFRGFSPNLVLGKNF